MNRKVNVIGLSLVICLSAVGGHYTWTWTASQIAHYKRELALWALTDADVSPRELAERGFFPDAQDIPRSCLDLCNSQARVSSKKKPRG